MVTNSSNNYRTNLAWFQDVLRDEDVILCYTSALECLQFFLGYGYEEKIDVYAKEKGKYENINYRIVSNYDDIEIVQVRNLRCTSIHQTVNDMLSDFDYIDEQSLAEALNMYYYTNNCSFDGLKILPENIEQFNAIKEWAIEC